MLRAIRVQDYRSFKDSGRLELADLNIFIGPNSAGKSNLMSVIQLALESMNIPNASTPLNLSSFPAFSSFDSVVRRYGSPRSAQAKQFSLLFEEIYEQDSQEGTSRRYTFGRSSENHAAVVDRAEFSLLFSNQPNKADFVIERNRHGSQTGSYFGKNTRDKEQTPIRAFQLGLPLFSSNDFDPVFENALSWSETVMDPLVVIRPNRPVPRTLYVLDDPNMSADDRDLISELLHLWGKQGSEVERVHIGESLAALGLASHIEVRADNRRRKGPQVAEVLISPRRKRQAMTLADVGFGVSQVLPLLTREARLHAGTLLAYQPEVHLHPFSQSRLADVFVNSVLRGNRVYVETHSEHLVLRLQTLVASGLIAPERVRVFCVEHDGELSHVHPMTFDARGVPAGRWPDGFLDTDMGLARELVQARQKAAEVPTRAVTEPTPLRPAAVAKAAKASAPRKRSPRKLA